MVLPLPWWLSGGKLAGYPSKGGTWWNQFRSPTTLASWSWGEGAWWFGSPRNEPKKGLWKKNEKDMFFFGRKHYWSSHCCLFLLQGCCYTMNILSFEGNFRKNLFLRNDSQSSWMIEVFTVGETMTVIRISVPSFLSAKLFDSSNISYHKTHSCWVFGCWGRN